MPLDNWFDGGSRCCDNRGRAGIFSHLLRAQQRGLTIAGDFDERKLYPRDHYFGSIPSQPKLRKLT